MTIATTEAVVPKWASAMTTPRQDSLPKSWFIYGQSGKGKSTFAASIREVPGFERVLILDTEKGTETLAQNPLYSDIQILHFDPVDDPYAKDKLEEVVTWYAKTPNQFDAIILDTFSIAQDIAEKAINRANPKGGFKNFGELGVWSHEIIHKMHSSPYFTGIITCHSMEQKAESGAHRILPRLTGSSKETIASIPSIVAHIEHAAHPETGERHRVLTLGEAPELVTKNRFGLPDKIVDPTMKHLYNLINERIGKTADAETTE